MKLEKLPSVIAQNKFNEKGLVETDSGLLVPAYVGSQLGFNVHGRHYLNNVFYPHLRALGVLPLCPFVACEEYLDLSKLNDNMSLREYREFWSLFNEIIGEVNYQTLMPRSKFMIALLDGSHGVDEGVASEVSEFKNKKYGPVIGIRSDFRLSENIVASINPAVRHFIDQFFEGRSAYDDAFKAIKSLAYRIREE